MFIVIKLKRAKWVGKVKDGKKVHENWGNSGGDGIGGQFKCTYMKRPCKEAWKYS